MAAPQPEDVTAFLSLLKAEGRRSVLGVDCRTGDDGLLFVRAGIHFTGVDASEEHIHAARERGLSASVATGRSLPFADASFAAVWAVDAVAGLAPGEADDVVRELGRVTAPGAPIAVVLPGADGPRRVTVLRSPAAPK